MQRNACISAEARRCQHQNHGAGEHCSARSAAETLTLGKTRICLDVFVEQGLIELKTCRRCYQIRITTDGSKVDLDASPIVRALRAAKAGNRP